jgi:hypothetical protein
LPRIHQSVERPTVGPSAVQYVAQVIGLPFMNTSTTLNQINLRHMISREVDSSDRFTTRGARRRATAVDPRLGDGPAVTWWASLDRSSTSCEGTEHRHSVVCPATATLLQGRWCPVARQGT